MDIDLYGIYDAALESIATEVSNRGNSYIGDRIMNSFDSKAAKWARVASKAIEKEEYESAIEYLKKGIKECDDTLFVLEHSLHGINRTADETSELYKNVNIVKRGLISHAAAATPGAIIPFLQFASNNNAAVTPAIVAAAFAGAVASWKACHKAIMKENNATSPAAKADKEYAKEILVKKYIKQTEGYMDYVRKYKAGLEKTIAACGKKNYKKNPLGATTLK